MPLLRGVKTMFFFRRNDERNPFNFFPLPERAKGIFGSFFLVLHPKKMMSRQRSFFAKVTKPG
jgi:hypothetical protein